MAFSTVSVALQTNPIQLPVHAVDFITFIQQHIDAGEFHEAIAELLFKLSKLQGTPHISQFYQLLFELFPYINQTEFAELKTQCLQELLSHSSALYEKMPRATVSDPPVTTNVTHPRAKPI